MSSQDDVSAFSQGGLVGEAFYAHFNTLSETVELINSDADKAVELCCVGISLKAPEKTPSASFVMRLQQTVTEASPTVAELHSSPMSAMTKLDMAHAAGIQTQFMNLPAETFLIEENGRVSENTIPALMRNFVDDENSVTPEECETKHSFEKEATSLCHSAIPTDLPFPTIATAVSDIQDDPQVQMICIALDHPLVAPSSSMAPIIIKSRKPRRKGDKPLVKLILSDPKQTSNIAQGSIVEYRELAAEGLKKQSALESLKQVQSLFKFTPRGPSAVEVSTSSKGLKGTKGQRHLSDYSGDALLEESYTDGVIGQECSLECGTLSNVLTDTVRPLGTDSEELDIPTDYAHSNDSNTVDVIPIEQKVKVKAKSKLKEEKKKLLAKSEIFVVPENVPTIPHSYEVATYDYSNSSSTYSDSSSSSLPSRSQFGSRLDTTVAEEIEIPEKIKGKRKYTFQQPGVKRISGVNSRDKIGANVLQTESIPCVGSREIVQSLSIPQPESQSHLQSQPQLQPQLESQSDSQSLDLIPLSRSDSLDTEGYSAAEETAIPLDEEDESPRSFRTFEDSDMADGVITVKAIRSEKKEGSKKVLRGESKECSMTDVPGRHLLGPKMLAFIRAFPEGDVVGNDDIETSAAQRYRMESWLQQLKDDGHTVHKQPVEGDELSVEAVHHRRSSEVNRIKVDLLKGIEKKLSKARNAGVRGPAGSSVPPHKPGMVQILLPYEIEILRTRNASQTIADGAALEKIINPEEVSRCGVQTAAEEVFPTTTTSASASASALSQHQSTAPTSSQSKRVSTSSGQDVSVTSEKSVASDVFVDSEGSEHDVKALSASDSHSSGRKLLCSMLGVVDAKVRVSNQLAQMHDIVRVKNAVEDRRVEQFVELGDLLTLKVSLLQSKHTISESEREGAQKESLNFIGSMEAEEKELAEKLKRIRDEISHAKRNLVEHQEASKLAKLSEKARIYTATRESNKCGEMLSTAERNKDLLRKFKAYVTALTGNPKWTPVSTEEGPKIKIAKTSDQEKEQKTVVLHGNTDSLNLMRKLSHWVERAQCQQSTQKTHETLQSQPATSVLLFSRLMYEGMRLSRRLLSKYNTSRCKRKPFEIKDDTSKALEITDSEGTSEMDEFEKLFTVQDLYNDDAQPLVSVLSDATLEKDSVLSECVMATVDDICRRVEIDAALKLPEACKAAEEPSAVKKGVTVVLCDPRNLSHLVPRKMPERSIRIVKIMAKLSALQMSFAEEKVGGSTRSNDDDGEKPIKLDAADMLMDICMSSTADVDCDGKVLSGLQLGDSEPLQHVGSYDESVQEDSSPRGDGDFYDRCAPRRAPTEELEIRCLARDASIALQDCFWESVALVHADEYIDHLRERAKAASCFNPPYLPMKDHAIAGEVDADVQFISLLQEEIPVDEADIRAAAEESGDPLPIAMLRRNARSSGRSGSCGSSSMGPNSNSNGNYAGYEDDGDMMGGKGRQRSSSTPLNRLAIPQNVADALLAFREEAWTPDFAPNDSDRVWMWDTMRCRRVGGYAAPFFKNLRDCLSRNSHFLVYTGQDDKEETPPIQWDIVQWLRQAVDLSAGGDFIIPTGTVRKAGDYQGDYEEERERIGPGGKRRKHDDSTSGLKSKFRDPASKFLVRTSKGTALSKSKGGLGLHGLSKRPLGHGTGDLMHPDMGEGEGEVKHKINLGAFSAFRRISVWNTVRRVRVSGGNAPMKKDLKAFLEEKPEYVIWTGQRVAGVDVDGDRRRVASKAKIIKKVSTKIGKPKAAPDSQKSRFSALSRVSVKASTVPSSILPAVQKDKIEKLDKGDKGDKVILPKLTKEELLMCVPAVRVKKEKKHFEASLFLPSSRRVGDRVRAKVAGGYGDEEGCYREPDIDGVEEGDGGEEGRVSLWNTVKQCRVAGGNAPYRRDLQEYLANRPEYCVYEGQEPLVPRMMKAERDALKSGRGRGRGRGGRGGRGRGRGCASVAHASPSHLTEVKPDHHTIPMSPTTATVPSPSELKVEKTTNTPQLSTKVQSASSSSCGTVPRPVKLLILSLPSESKKKAGKSVAQLLEDSMASPIPLWNSRRKSCLSGRNAPIRSLLVKFLATRPEYEIYTGQDLRDNDDDELTRILALSIAGDDAPQLSYAAERISMWDNVRLLKIEGEEAPMRCDLTDYIATHPDRDVYINQEEVLEAERNRNMESDSDSDASSVKKIYKSSKAKNKIAQLLANLRPKKEADVVPSTAAAAVVCAPAETVNVNLNTYDWIEESNTSSSSSKRPDTAEVNVNVLRVGGEECLEVPVVKVEVVPLKRGRKARCLKRLESSLHDKAVKPLKKGHVSVWNTLRQCRVSGGNAPLRSQLTKFLITRPEYEVWVGQERQRKKRSPSDQGAVDGMDNEAFDGVYDEIAGDADGDEETDDHSAPMDHAPQENDMTFDTDPVYEHIPISTPHLPSTALPSTLAADVQPIYFPPFLESVTQASQQQQQQTDHISIVLEVPDVLTAVIQTPEKSPLHGRASRKRSLSLSLPMPMPMPNTVTGTAIGNIPSFPQLHAPAAAVLQEKIDTHIEAIADSVITPLPDLPGVDATVVPSSPSIHNVNNIHLRQYPTAESIPPENLMSVTSLPIPVPMTAPMSLPIDVPMTVPMTVPMSLPIHVPMNVPMTVPMTVSMNWVEQELLPVSIQLPIETVSSSASHKVDNEPEQSLPDTVYREAEVVIPQVDLNPDTNHTAKTEKSRQGIPAVLSDKGVVVLPSRAKRRRELANTEDSSSFMAFSSIDDEAEEPSPSGDGHQINGRSIIGDRFIRHCGEDSVVSGPGWWEDLDIGASDTYISPCSFDAAVAAAAVVCAGVDAVTLGQVTGCDLLAAAKAHDDALAAATAQGPNLSGPSIPSSLDSDIGEKEVNIEQIIQSSSSSMPEVTAVVERIAPTPALAAPTSSSSSSAASATSTEVIEEVMEDVMEEVVEDADPLETVRMEQMNDLLDGIREEQKLVTLHVTVTHIEPSHSVVNSVDHELSQSNTEESTLMQSCDGVTASSSSLIIPVESNGDIPHYTDKIVPSPHPVVPYNDVNTRSRAGAKAAAGVLTSETLGSIAADTPVVLTDVEGVKNVFCCIRPPGHHAGRFGSTRGCSNNGFCLLNNVAIGAYYARIKYGLRRFAVVDIDAHFGNGTAEIFEGDPHAFYSSVHLQYDGPKNYFFPSSTCCILGAEERNPNRVLVNVYPPVRAGNPLSKSGKPRSRRGFRTAFEDVILPALKAFNPDIIFISAGFDGAATDPIGGQMGLKPVDFHWMAEKIQVVADEVCGGRVVSVLEGGYDVSKAADGLATCAEAHVLALAGREFR